MKPFLAIPAKAPKDRLLLVFHQDAQGKTQQKFLNDSEEAHRGGSIRFVNFGLERAAFSAGGATTVVVPGGEATAIPVANSEGRYPFTYSVGMRGRPPYESPTKLLRMLMPEQRLLILYTFLPETVTTEKSAPEGSADTKLVFQPMAYRLYDTL